MNYTTRRRYGMLALVVISSLSIGIYKIFSLSLLPTGIYSGWLLFITMVGLTLYNARKKLPFIPAFPSAIWLQIHIYAGLLTFVLFLIHIEFRIPNGPFEVTLAILYLLVFFSGVIGLVFSRVVPSLLSHRGEEVIFERIPIFRERLRRELEELVLAENADTQMVTIAEFYAGHLVRFFNGHKNTLRHLTQSTVHRNALLERLDSLKRYMNEEEKEVAEVVGDFIVKKDDLDFHYSFQLLLKVWLFMHIPLTYSLLIFALVHGVLIYAFIGGI
jgi:hypothetical protein